MKVIGKISVEPTMFNGPMAMNFEDIDGTNTNTPTKTPVNTFRSLKFCCLFKSVICLILFMSKLKIVSFYVAFV